MKDEHTFDITVAYQVLTLARGKYAIRLQITLRQVGGYTDTVEQSRLREFAVLATREPGNILISQPARGLGKLTRNLAPEPHRTLPFVSTMLYFYPRDALHIARSLLS